MPMTTAAVRFTARCVPRLGRLDTGSGRGDGGRAEHGVAGVAGRRPGRRRRRGPARRSRTSTVARVAADRDDRRHRRAVRPQLDHAPERLGRRRAGRPHRTVAGHRGDVQRPPGPTVTVLVTGVIDSTYRGRPSGPGRSRRSPRRWPTVKPYAPVVPADHRAGRGVDDLARAGRRAGRRRKPRVSPSAMKQMSCESGLSATASPRARRLGPHLGLGRVAEREHRPVPAGRGSARPARTTGPWPGRPSAAAAPSAPSRAWWPVTTASKPSASARSSTAANLIFSLQRRHGFGVRPAAYSATKSSTTSAWNRSARSQT